MKMSNPDNQMVDLTNIDKMTDREIQRIDHEFRMSIVKIKEEKGKRGRHRKSCENLSMNSSGHLKNFIRPYNLTSIYSTNRKTSEAQSLTQRSKCSSPGSLINSYREQIDNG